MRTQLFVLAGLLALCAAVLFLSPDYWPRGRRFLTYESARTVLESNVEVTEPRIRQVLAEWGFVEVTDQPVMRSDSDFYSCMGSIPTDEAKLLAIFRRDEVPTPIFAEVRLAEVEPNHAYVGIDFHTSPGTKYYTNRVHRREADRRVAQLQEKAERWYRLHEGAPHEFALYLQYSPDRKPGTSYFIPRSDFTSMHPPLPAWLVDKLAPAASASSDPQSVSILSETN